MARVLAFVGRDPRQGASTWTLGRRATDSDEAERRLVESRLQDQEDRLTRAIRNTATALRQ